MTVKYVIVKSNRKYNNIQHFHYFVSIFITKSTLRLTEFVNNPEKSSLVRRFKSKILLNNEFLHGLSKILHSNMVVICDTLLKSSKLKNNLCQQLTYEHEIIFFRILYTLKCRSTLVLVWIQIQSFMSII